MQKIRITMLYGLIAVTAATLYFCTFLHVNAGYIKSSEVGFSHVHGNACYTEVTQNCISSHTVQKSTTTGTYHCTTCSAQTEHWVVVDHYKCSRLGVTWQKNGRTNCKICGTQHSYWDESMPGTHTYKEKKINCNIEEGEITTTFCISAEDGWTNSGVMLTANVSELKQDLTTGSVSCSWEGGKLYVTENGTYSATATDASGRSLTASIDIHCIDKISPVIKSVNADTNGMTKSSVYVTVSAEDHESGLDAQAYSFDGGQSWSASSGFLLEEGKEVVLAVRDRAGNIATRTLKRSAFPYPPEPTPSPVPTPTAPTVPSEQTGQGSSGTSSSSGASSSSPSSNRSEETASGKTSLQKEATTTPTQTPGTGGSHTGEENMPASQKNRLTAERENLDVTNNDEQGKDGEGADILSVADMLSQMAGICQKQEGTMKLLNAAILGIGEKCLSSIGSTFGRANTMEDFGNVQKLLAVLAAYIRDHLQALLGIGLLALGGGLLCRIVWLHSAILYCYNGGEEYRRIGLLHLHKKKQEFELYLPEYLLETRGTPRYRLMLKSRLVKRYGGVDLVVRGEDYKLRQPLEECVDFVL
ncbi:MAG: hypothetical protein J1E65_01280 [Lachnospiraceae bacterium]|nr:hypothetical protein [Lachnospiraceae bacterium]